MRADFELQESQFQTEYPYLTQSFSWREGMRYKYCPQSYPLIGSQVDLMAQAGKLVGKYLQTAYKNLGIIEFRIDFVSDANGGLYITEVQTDDRGLPAMAIARNSRGKLQPEIFPGVSASFCQSLREYSGNSRPSLLISYPDQEYFYYSSFYDLARLCWGEDPDVDITVEPISAIEVLGKDSVRIKNKGDKSSLIMQPTLTWDFSGKLPEEFDKIQSPVDKQLLIDVWSKPFDSTKKSLQYFIPEVTRPQLLNLADDKRKWIIKPINGRWSKGVILGYKASTLEWASVLGKDDHLLAQRFIQPVPEVFEVRNDKGDYSNQIMFSRVEGYYCLLNSNWRLVDVLATCTPDLPVHGRRDCIMIPGQQIDPEDEIETQ